MFMPLWIGDYLADTTELSAEEHGAYLLLLFTAWRRGGRLPTDQEQLRRAARVGERRWQKVWGMIARFFTADGDALVQARLTEELAKAQAKRAAAAVGGRASGEARRKERPFNDRSTTVQRDGERIGNGEATDRPTETQRNANPSPSTPGSLSSSRSDLSDLRADPAGARSETRAIALRDGQISGHELRRVFGLVRERAIPGSLGWQVPAVADGKDAAMAEIVNDGGPSARADVVPTMELLFRLANDGKAGDRSADIREDGSFAFGTWCSKWTSLRERLHRKGPAAGFIPRPFPSAAKAAP